MLNNFYVCGPTDEAYTTLAGFEKVVHAMDSGLMYSVFRNQGQGPITCRLKSLDRFYDTMLPSTVVLTGMDEFKIFQHCICILSLVELQWGYSQSL